MLIAPVLLAVATSQVANVDAGKALFTGLCARCHGMEGTGDEGPALNRATLTRAGTDDTLREIIRDGIPDRGMPRVRSLSQNELDQLVAYVRSLGRAAATPVAGTIANGQAVYQRLGCAACHIIEGRGSSFGPDLSESGVKHERWFLKQSIIGPGESLPKNSLPVPGRGFTEYLPVRIVANDGREVRGIRINEDPFTIQLRDPANRFYSFRKADVKDIEKEFGQSFMPSYRGRLSDEDAEDLISYLKSLQRGAQ